MKKFFKSICNKVNGVVCLTKATVETKKAEDYVDSGVKILIAVVIGALLLAGLYALFNITIIPTVTNKVTELFSYNG